MKFAFVFMVLVTFLGTPSLSAAASDPTPARRAKCSREKVENGLRFATLCKARGEKEGKAALDECVEYAKEVLAQAEIACLLDL